MGWCHGRVAASDVHRSIEAVWRIEAGRLIAGLAGLVRDVGVAEELAQDALVAALEQWPGSGVPRNPGAWLMTVAKRRAIDLIRRRERYERKLTELGRDLAEPGGDVSLCHGLSSGRRRRPPRLAFGPRLIVVATSCAAAIGPRSTLPERTVPLRSEGANCDSVPIPRKGAPAVGVKSFGSWLITEGKFLNQSDEKLACAISSAFGVRPSILPET